MAIQKKSLTGKASATVHATAPTKSKASASTPKAGKLETTVMRTLKSAKLETTSMARF